jgi:23S rRNA (cytosine1962-C5)-methyltransferase
MTDTQTRAETNPIEPPSGEYALLDSGNMQRLEKIGPYTLIRPAPQAIWPPALSRSVWNQADAVFERDETGGGTWDWRRKIPREFDILFDSLIFRIKLTDFGHLGLFPEQAANWQWLRDTIRNRLQHSGRNLHVLNLFAYTGGSTLAASQAGAHVVHLDAAKGVVDWARKNAELAHLDERPIRWLVDDAMKFLKREVRRGNKYHGIILDPPSFGRGPKGEVFKIENEIIELLGLCNELMDRHALFLLYSCHTPGFTPLGMENQLQATLHSRGKIDSGEMVVLDSKQKPLPSGVWARWSVNDAARE